MSLPQAKVDILAEQMIHNFYNTGDLDAAKIEAIIRDQCDDALHDAFGQGEAEERKRVVKFLYGMGGRSVCGLIENGAHDPPDPAHLERCRKLTEGK